jgi:hypothetical protein
MTGSQEEARNYLVGLLSASIVIFTVFATWLMVILVLKCIGYNRVGFLSGSAVRLPSPPAAATSPTDDELGEGDQWKRGDHEKDDDDEGDKKDVQTEVECNPHDVGSGNLDGGENENIVDRSREANLVNKTSEALEAWEKQVRSIELRLQRIRIAVILCGLAIVALAIVMVVYGVRGLQSSFSDGMFGLVQGENLANSGVSIINSFIYSQNSTLTAAQQVIGVSNQTICPEAKQRICSISVSACSVLENYPSFLAGLDQLYFQLEGTKSDLVETAILLNNANEYISTFEWAFWVAAGCVLLYAICVIFILNGIILTWRKKLHGTPWQRTTSRFRGWFIIPVFVILLILGWIFSMVFVIGSAATGDFCYNSPDNNVVVRLLVVTLVIVGAISLIVCLQVLLNQNKYRFNSKVFQALVYYASGCPENTSNAVPLPPGMPNATELTIYADTVYQAFNIISSESDEIAAVCGTNADSVQASLAVLESQVCTIVTTLNELLEYFSCKNMNPVYAQVAYNGRLEGDSGSANATE